MHVSNTLPETLFRLSILLCLPVSFGCVTGGDPVTASGRQAETAADTSYHAGIHRVVVTYNDDTNNDPTLIQYTSTSRTILRGTSQMGWSYSEDQGKTWTYGGKVATPPGWPVLWGDPAITTSRAHYSWMFLSNLAIPESKFPESGISGPVNDYIGGACIARSLDGGVHFQHFQCLSSIEAVPDKPGTSNGHFYDGGSMASGELGEIYASFRDVNTNEVVIWRSPDGNQPFQRLSTPFPSMYVGSHPRIRVARDNTLYVMASILLENNQFAVYANRFIDGQWGSPKYIADVVVDPDVDLQSSVLGQPLRIRTGPQFSFDIGAASEDRDDSIRFLVTQPNPRGWLFVRGGVCDAQLNTCGWYRGWTFGESGQPRNSDQRLDVFNPNVTAFPLIPLVLGPRWQGTFVTRYGNSTTTINLTRATLGYANGVPVSIPVDILRDMPVCSDLRGYWGDYDAFLFTAVQRDSVQFTRFTTDSVLGCTRRWLYVGDRQHVRAVSYSY